MSLACAVAALSLVSIASTVLWGTFEKAFYKHVSRSRSFVQDGGPDDLERELVQLSNENTPAALQNEDSVTTFFYQTNRSPCGFSTDHPVSSVSFIQRMRNQFSHFFSDEVQEGGIEMKDRRSVPADCLF